MALLKNVNRESGGKNNNHLRFKKLSMMGKRYRDLMSRISNPIDSTNRFINLALNTVGDDSQGRQFLLESKQGIRKTAVLLKKLNDYSQKIEKEVLEMAKIDE
jgi:hypothetical protein